MAYLSLFLAAIVIARATAGAGFRLGIVDEPDARKHHQVTTCLTGGIAIFLTLLAGISLFGIRPYSPSMLAVAVTLLSVGVFDDIRHVSATSRLLIQYAGGVALATLGGIALHGLGNLLGFGDIPLLFMSMPLTALAVVGLCNAYNMIDGIDGLAAATVALPLLALYSLALQAGHPRADFLLLMLIPLGVFLLFNLGPRNRWLPRVFLGDGGSVSLGFVVAASLIYFSQGENALIRPVTALWLVALPLMDMLATMLRRARNGLELLQADRSHLHHTLMYMGFTARQTLLLMVFYAVLCAVAGLALEALPEYLSLLIYCLLFGAHCLFALNAHAVGGFVSRRHSGANPASWTGGEGCVSAPPSREPRAACRQTRPGSAPARARTVAPNNAREAG
jgi:UDP-GlcNAc:undecaprenyl-phosphate GlcNAc-1-phosphate transferase